jgi:hypothetical protein
MITDLRSNMLQKWMRHGCRIVECYVGINEISDVGEKLITKAVVFLLVLGNFEV